MSSEINTGVALPEITRVVLRLSGRLGIRSAIAQRLTIMLRCESRLPGRNPETGRGSETRYPDYVYRYQKSGMDILLSTPDRLFVVGYFYLCISLADFENRKMSAAHHKRSGRRLPAIRARCYSLENAFTQHRATVPASL
jgi:hypothetical protein